MTTIYDRKENEVYTSKKATLREAVIEAYIENVSLKGAILEGIDLSEIELEGIDLREAVITGCNFNNTSLKHALMTECYIRNSTFNGAELNYADMRNSSAMECTFNKTSLSDVNISNCNSAHCAFTSVSFHRVNAHGANIKASRFEDVYFHAANLFYTNFESAFMEKVMFCHANLNRAGLRYAALRDCNFDSATLTGCLFHEAKIDKRSMKSILKGRSIVGEGDLIGYKKLDNDSICKLLIPADARRVGGVIGRKCRAEYAVVLEGSGQSMIGYMQYRKGKKMIPDKFNPDPLVECTNGIHFFITEQEAKDYEL